MTISNTNRAHRKKQDSSVPCWLICIVGAFVESVSKLATDERAAVGYAFVA
jgi:hypothetical protein